MGSFRSLRSLRSLGFVLLCMACAACGGSGYVASNPGTPPMALPAKIPGVCRVDVSNLSNTKICAVPHGPFDLCMTNVASAFGELLAEIGTKACAGGDAATPWTLALTLRSLTRVSEDRPATGLAALGRDGATESHQTFTMLVYVEVRDPGGQAVTARDIEVSRDTSGLDFDTVGAGLVEDAMKQIVDVFTKQAAIGWTAQR